LQSKEDVCIENAGVCGGKAEQFAAVIAQPVSQRRLVAIFSDTYASFYR
jgi:hypothetical protein